MPRITADGRVAVVQVKVQEETIETEYIYLLSRTEDRWSIVRTLAARRR